VSPWNKSGETIVIDAEQAKPERAEEVIAASRKHYAKEYVKPAKSKAVSQKPNSKPRGTKGGAKRTNALGKSSMKHSKSDKN